MPGYIENALVRFGHEPPVKPQMQPYPHTFPTYGANIQYAKAAGTSPPIGDSQLCHLCFDGIVEEDTTMCLLDEGDPRSP